MGYAFLSAQCSGQKIISLELRFWFSTKKFLHSSDVQNRFEAFFLKSTVLRKCAFVSHNILQILGKIARNYLGCNRLGGAKGITNYGRMQQVIASLLRPTQIE